MAKTNSSLGGKKRLYILTGIFFLWCAAIGCRLIYLQIFHYQKFIQRAERQQQRTIDVSPRRGVIYDRNGNELAMSITVDSVYAVSSEIPDHQSTAALLSKILKMDAAEIRRKLKSSRGFTWIARKVDKEASDRIRALNLKGIYFEKESRRFYPKRELGAQVLGYVGMDDEGLAGIERQFDEQLRGTPGSMLVEIDARRKSYARRERKPEPGQNVVLTIDEKIQYIAERELDVAMKETKSESGSVIVQNPRTGEILALATRPGFNPNKYRGASAEALKNHAVSDVYEPGSTFKILTLAAALEEKVTTPEEVIDCQNGAIFIGRHRIRDHHPFGLLNVTQVLAHSSDVGVIKLALRLGEQRFDSYIRKFGFGSKTGIELPGETRGIARPVNRWSSVSIGALAMGQEIGVTPLQLAAMTSAIANDGIWSAPRIVAGTRAPEAKPQQIVYKPAEQRRVVSPLTAVELKKMLEHTVLFGTGRKAILNGYTSAGKTGTAQKIDPSTGTYHSWKHVASFAGFAPIKDPEITVVVVLDSAVGLHEGGQIAAPVFRRVTQQVLAYMNVPHDAEPQTPAGKQLLMASATAGTADLTESSAERLSADYSALAAELAAEQQAVAEPAVPSLVPAAMAQPVKSVAPKPQKPTLKAPPGQLEPPRGTIILNVDAGGVVVPSFSGRPLRQVLEVAQEAGIEVDVIGTGLAVEQAPAAGSRVAPGAHVAVRFSR